MMNTMRAMMLVALAGVSAGVQAADQAVWNEMRGEKLQALMDRGDAARGKAAFQICTGCHRDGGVGRPDGSYPRLAGQHHEVLVKQLVDIRDGKRQNPKMLPFADKHVISTQDVADIAVYLEGLNVTPDNGKGPGLDLAEGEKIYDQDCATCHGDQGQGDALKFYPRLNGQHYAYLLRESRNIRDGARGNANPKMVKAIRHFTDPQLEATLDYVSRLPVMPR